MTEAEIWVMNHMFWLMGDWMTVLALSIGVATGIILTNRYYFKNSWKQTIFCGSFGMIISGGLYMIYAYIHFVHIWKDIIINGNY